MENVYPRSCAFVGASLCLVVLVGCSYDLGIVPRPTDRGVAGDLDRGPEAGPDSVVPDSIVPDIPMPDSAVIDSIVPDIPMPDSAVIDSTAPDSTVPDSSVPDASAPDSVSPDSAKPDSVVPDSSEPDSAMPDSTVPDSSVPDGAKPKSWPYGSKGVLNVSLGTVKIKPDVIHDYSGITIGTLGTLEIEAGSKWVVIGVNGNVKIDGKLVARRGKHAGGTHNLAMPDTKGQPGSASLPYKWPQNNGGGGGWCFQCGSPGSQAYGNGGGGAAYTAAGKNATSTEAGDGASSYGTKGKPGAGAEGYGEAGMAGCKCGSGGTGTGGGGGFRGYHGHALFFQVRGNVTGSGTIDVSGMDGNAGGAAGPGYAQGGGGGGGGAGGSGGWVVFKVTGKVTLPLTNIKRAGGKGGAGGAATNGTSKPGNPGQGGTTGATPQVFKWTE